MMVRLVGFPFVHHEPPAEALGVAAEAAAAGPLGSMNQKMPRLSKDCAIIHHDDFLLVNIGELTYTMVNNP